MKRYVLYCGQEANFQTRSMLIPYDKVLSDQELKHDLEMLRKHAKKTKLNGQGKEFEIDQLIVVNYKYEGNVGRQEITEYTAIANRLTWLADGRGPESWYQGVITHLIGGFNNVKNYIKLRNMKSYEGEPVEIVEGFLVLEARDDKLIIPPVDTVEEMFAKYYQE